MLRNTPFIGARVRLVLLRNGTNKAMLRLTIRRFALVQPHFRQSHRAYSEPVPVKTFESSSFALPKNTRGVYKAPKDAGAKASDANTSDFDKTRLIRGSTDLKIAITDRAKLKLVAIAEEHREADFVLKVKVESGGCHGFQYSFELTSLNEELAKDEELIIFQREDTDLATVVFDESSLEILQDSKLDYTHELIGSSFIMVDSPYTSTSCGCGASFDFDFEKLENAKNKA